MRTSIVLDDSLVEKAFQHAKVKTKRELVDLALREFVAARESARLAELFGTGSICEDYDHKNRRARSD